MRLHEAILSAAGPSGSSAPALGSIALHDISSGSQLASFKQSSSRTHCLAVNGTKSGQGGWIIASQVDKPVLNVYNFQKDQIASKMVLPEKLTCIAADPRGAYCAAGTAQGRIYLWEIASGIMYAAWDAHYRAVSVLRFTHDSAALLAGSEDAGVSVWSVARLLDDDAQDDIPAAYALLADHTLPVTDIRVGVGAFPHCRAISASLDHSAKIWDLAARTLLSTFHFPTPIGLLALDPAERAFFAAAAPSSPTGHIHQVNLFRQRAAVGGRGAGDTIRVGDASDPADADQGARLFTAGEPLTALALSLSGALLLAGTAAGRIHIFDAPSHQRLRTIAPPSGPSPGLAITHLETCLRPVDLVGHVALDLDVRAGAALPVAPVAPFQRTRDARSRDAHVVGMLLPERRRAVDSDAYSADEMLRDQAFFLSPETPRAGGGDARTRELEEEVKRLQGELGKAKAMNDEMWERVVKKVVKQGSSKEEAGGDDEEPKRKRGKS